MLSDQRSTDREINGEGIRCGYEEKKNESEKKRKKKKGERREGRGKRQKAQNQVEGTRKEKKIKKSFRALSGGQVLAFVAYINWLIHFVKTCSRQKLSRQKSLSTSGHLKTTWFLPHHFTFPRKNVYSSGVREGVWRTSYCHW
jgi:hypothetical protein